MTEPRDPTAAAEKSVDGMVRQAMNDHLRSLIAGQPERVRSDYADSVRERVPEFERLVPAGLKSYTFLRDRAEPDASHMTIRLEGDQARDVEWVWSNQNGRFRIVNVRPAS
jgi:hypothetical protein